MSFNLGGFATGGTSRPGLRKMSARQVGVPPPPILKAKDLLHDSAQSHRNKEVTSKVLQTKELSLLFWCFGTGIWLLCAIPRKVLETKGLYVKYCYQIT